MKSEFEIQFKRFLKLKMTSVVDNGEQFKLKMSSFVSTELDKMAKSPQREACESLQEFKDSLNWRTDGEDTLLDIGCGNGETICKYILPILPKTFKRLIGVDTSEELIQQAQQQNVQPKVFFERFDVGVDLKKQTLRYVQPVDHITSFIHLHFVNDQKQAVQNIYNLLKPDGDCLLVSAGNNPTYESWEQLSLTSKWGKYMEDVDQFIGSYHNSVDPADEIGQLFRDSGFSEYSVLVREKFATFDDFDALKSKLCYQIPLKNNFSFSKSNVALF